MALLDWIVVILMLGIMLYIGYMTSRGTKSQKDYILGGKSMNSRLVGLSLFATLFSTLSYLAYPGEMIKYGPLFCAGILSFPVAGWIINRFLIPKFVSLNVTSAYEILEIKLGPVTRSVATVFFISLRFLWMSTIVYATVSAGLIPIIGIPEIYAPLLSAVMILITVIYTTIGGIKAVVWTDAIQSLVMFLGAALAIAVVVIKVDVADVISTTNLCSHWLEWDWAPRMDKRMTVANIFIMNLLWQVCTAGSDQMAIQRYLSVKDAREASRSYWISLGSSALIQLLLAAVGFFIMIYFSVFPENGLDVVRDADIMFPHFIVSGLPSGLTGLIASALMAAAMSSLSGGLNSTSTVIQEDIIKRMPRFRDKNFSLRNIKVISAILGVAVIISCFLVSYVSGNLFDVVVKVVNLVVAPLFVLFFMAFFIPFAKDWATGVAGIVSLIVAILIAFFNIFGITPLWIMPSALVSGVVAGVALSSFSYIFHTSNN